LLAIFVCRSILQKPNVLQELLRRERSEVVKIGYARVSTLDQHLDLQMQALKKVGCRKTFREKVSGVSRQRPEFQRMLDQLRDGDTVIVWRLDRLARSTRDLLETMETIREVGARFQSLSEPWSDTTTHAGKLIMTVFAGIAEFERDLIRERTKTGRDAARKGGVRFGRPRKLNPEQAKLAAAHQRGKTDSTDRRNLQCPCGYDIPALRGGRIKTLTLDNSKPIHKERNGMKQRNFHTNVPSGVHRPRRRASQRHRLE
jgi:DNA invertase Pin-like site-specific DNA recombinase